MLDKEVDQWHERAEEARSQVFPIFNRGRVRRAERDAARRPGQGSNNVRDHQNIVPVVIVGRGDVSPSAAGQRPQQAHEGHEAGELGPGLPRQEVEETDEGESGPRCDGDEDHEERALGVSVANCRRDGGEPFLWVAVPLILDDLVVVQRDADDQGTDEGRWRIESQLWQLDSVGIGQVKTYCRRQWCAPN